MQWAKDVDPAEDAVGAKGGGFTAKCYGLMGLGWRVTKKLAVASAAISSAPMVLPPLFVVSALSLIFSIPSTAFLAWYAATDKLMRFLLPPAPAHLLLPPSAAGSMITEEEEDKEGEIAEEREVIVIGAHGSVELDETAAGIQLEESGREYNVPFEGGEEPGHLSSEVTADSAGLDYTADQPVPEQVEKGEGDEAPVIMIQADGAVEPDEMIKLDEAGRGYGVLPGGGGELGHLPAEITSNSATLDYTGGEQEVPEQVEKEEGEEAPEGAGGRHVVPVEGGEMEYLPAEGMADSTAIDYAGDLTVPEHVEEGGGKGAPEAVGGENDIPVEGREEMVYQPPMDSASVDYTGDQAVPEKVDTGEGALHEAGGRYDVPVEGGEEMDYQPRMDSAALGYAGDEAVPEKVDTGEGDEVLHEEGRRFDGRVLGGVDVANLPAEGRVGSAVLDYAHPAVPEQMKTREYEKALDEAWGRYDVPVEGGVDVAHLPAEERVESAAVDYAYLPVQEQVKTRAPEGVSEQYGVAVDGGVDVAHLPAEERLAGSQLISELQYPYGDKEARSPGVGAKRDRAERDHESLPPPAPQEALEDVETDTKRETSPVIASEMGGTEEKEPVVVPAKSQAMRLNGRRTREEPAVEKVTVPPVASGSMDAGATIAVPAPSQVEGLLMEVPVMMTAAVVGTNAAIVVQQEGFIVDHAPVTEKPVTPTVMPVHAASVPSAKEDAQPRFTEETMWEQIEALRMIIGYTVARQASLMEELKALYLFTGVEPPVSYGDPSNLTEVGSQLQFLKSVVGVI